MKLANLISPGEILGHAMAYLNEQTPRNSDAVEILNVAWAKGLKEWNRERVGESPAPARKECKVDLDNGKRCLLMRGHDGRHSSERVAAPPEPTRDAVKQLHDVSFREFERDIVPLDDAEEIVTALQAKLSTLEEALREIEAHSLEFDVDEIRYIAREALAQLSGESRQ